MDVKVSLSEGTEDSSVSFMQSRFWGDFKAEHGWKPLVFNAEAQGCSFQLLMLIRRMPAGFSFAYVPHGPELEVADADAPDLLSSLAEALRPYLPPRCLFLRFDPPWYRVEEAARVENTTRADDAEGEIAASRGEDSSDAPAQAATAERPAIGRPLREAAAYVQVPDTVLVDLGPDEAGILAAMKSKWRYNIRLAEKKGVVVEEAGVDGIPVFYELYRTTSARDKIALHPESYYRRLFALAAERRGSGDSSQAPDVRLWIARHDGQALAANITLFRGEKAVYLYGASSDEKRNLMPTYALQWAAMRAAKAAGCLEYDLFGMPPTADPAHPMHGLYLFKTGFGGRIVHRPGSWDYPLAKLSYAAFRAAESARTWYFKDFKKRLRRA
jgi:Uncharacterized protein involved in methicillin resistance